MREVYFMNLCIGSAGLVISILGLMQVLMSPHSEQRAKKIFIAFFSIMAAIAVFNLAGQFVSTYVELQNNSIPICADADKQIGSSVF